MSKAQFSLVFVLLPFLACSILPSLLFGVLFGEWGSNLIWGSYFGLGWCVAAFWSGGLVHDLSAARIGIAWSWLALLPLYPLAGLLWEKTSVRGRNVALATLGLSALLSVPARAVMYLEECGIHIPDYTLHMALSY
ncbi:hypothetical protein OK349_07575 [Sphingomonas sp. BT-65]|uniref:hypothetical protein n=1 Tax=Sphingomonas sp. BT-65 TaxID=2989821 RepID=UPI002235480C|nr:hypothetical protein [Sphingomonas sp. BT-65]MCW4461563.1 hypothetical protein [Sphingomonas sp. BT-65]